MQLVTEVTSSFKDVMGLIMQTPSHPCSQSYMHFSLLHEELAVSVNFLLRAVEMYRIVAVFVTKIVECFVVRNPTFRSAGVLF